MKISLTAESIGREALRKMRVQYLHNQKPCCIQLTMLLSTLLLILLHPLLL